MSLNLFALVFGSDDPFQPDDLVRLRQEIQDDGSDDQTTVIIDPALADRHGIQLDARGFPKADSLEAWHRKHNPHLFND